MGWTSIRRHGSLLRVRRQGAARGRLAVRAVLSEHAISGVPDVVFHNAAFRHLYVAIGDPGVLDVFDTETLRRLESVPTERGAPPRSASTQPATPCYAFLPDTHRAAVLPGPARVDDRSPLAGYGPELACHVHHGGGTAATS